jgi:hypothetical protein
MLSVDQLKFAVQWYVDGSHQVYKDCGGQTSSFVMLGKGAISSLSNKMNRYTKSSTETEFILFADKLTDIVWM